MKDKGNFDFIGNNVDISSHSSEKRMEDIVSDSHYSKRRGKYAKRKRRTKFGMWWSGLKKWQRRTIASFTAVILILAFLLGTLRIVFDYNYKNIDKDNLGFENVIDKKVVNIALFGIDSRDMKSFKGLSDSIMILSVNTETKKIKVISVMRDSLVPIESGKKTKYTKINSAYATGGAPLAIRTLNTIFGLDISEYATVNFQGMSKIIDAVGGIDVTLADGELDVYGYENGHKMNWGLNGLIREQCSYMGVSPDGMLIKKGGTYHLNGIQATAYARIRHAANADGENNDYGRTDRQRYVMEQLFNKAVNLDKSKYIKLVKALIPCCETSLSYTEIMGLAVNVLLSSPKFEQTRVPLIEYQMSSQAYVYYDLDYAAKIIKAFIYDDISPEKYIEANGIEKNDWYSKALGKLYSGTTKKSSGSTSKSSSGSTSKSSTGSSSKKSSSSSKSSVSSDNDIVSEKPAESEINNGETSHDSGVSTDVSSVVQPTEPVESTTEVPQESSAPEVPSQPEVSEQANTEE